MQFMECMIDKLWGMQEMQFLYSQLRLSLIESSRRVKVVVGNE